MVCELPRTRKLSDPEWSDRAEKWTWGPTNVGGQGRYNLVSESNSMNVESSRTHIIGGDGPDMQRGRCILLVGVIVIPWFVVKYVQ